MRADAAAGARLDVTVGGESRRAASAADGTAGRGAGQLPPVTASAHGVAARTAADEMGKPDFGKALRRWLDLERDRMFGELSNLDQVQAVAQAYTGRDIERTLDRVPALERVREPAPDGASEPRPLGALRLVR